MKSIKKKNLDIVLKEFIDSEMNIIGYNAEPTNGPDLASKAGTQTTDYNARIAHQNFKSDFLGRFGFWFYETEVKANPLKSDLAKLFYDADMKLHDNMDSTKQFAELTEEQAKLYNGFADNALQICRKHIKELVKGAKNKPVTDDITESDLRKMAEDKLAKKNDGSIAAKKNDSDVLPDTIKKISGLVSKLSKEERDVLMKHLK